MAVIFFLNLSFETRKKSFPALRVQDKLLWAWLKGHCKPWQGSRWWGGCLFGFFFLFVCFGFEAMGGCVVLPAR